MKHTIDEQLTIVGNAINWVRGTESMRGPKGDTAYRNLVNHRRQLNRKKFALEHNPAAAIYGESQVGKSYLISSLLSEEGKPFSISDGNNHHYNFIETINPPGGGSESTSLVSRFSVNYKPLDARFPVKASLLSPVDIVLVLCDSFYSDIKTNHESSLQVEDINAAVEDFRQKFENRQQQQTVFTEDHVLDIKDYCRDYLPKANAVLSSLFFEQISLLIAKIRPDEWTEVFSLLWYRNNTFSSLFSSLIAEFKKIDFTDVVYLPLDSVLYRHGTLLDVERLKEIYGAPNNIEADYKADTILLCEGREIKFTKSYLCALASELVFSQPASLLETKPFLKDTDLLDFPGARSRMTLPQDLIEDKNVWELLLRGKVAYLFNRYSDAEKINVLLLCAKPDQPAQRALPEILDNWVRKIVGDSPEKRESFVKRSKIPPLFIVGTFFNINLQYDPQKDSPGDNTHMNYRWNQRFERTLAQQILNTKAYDWFRQWTISQPQFQNLYLLRDFGRSETISNIFRGYNLYGRELEAVIPEQYPDFRERLRQSFLEYGFVKNHFENPAESWDRAASINEDGTRLIIEKLTIAAENIDAARREKNVAELAALKAEILRELKKHFHDANSDNSLKKAKSTAGTIQARLDRAFSENPYFFGMLMNELLLKQSDVYNLYLQKIRDLERRDLVNMARYSAFRMRVPELNPNDKFEVNLERLRATYEKSSLEECQHFFEQEEGIDLNELFYGNFDRVKNFSEVLSEALVDYFFDQHMLLNKQNLSRVFSEAGLQDILEMMRLLFTKLQVTKRVADKIRHYVHGSRDIEHVYDMIADISTEMINTFINTVGIAYMSDPEIADLKRANDTNELGLVLEHGELHFAQNTAAEVAALITDMGNLADLLNQNPLPLRAKRLPNYRNYIIWSDLLKVGFVSVCDIPNYDEKANDRLRDIIEACQTIQYQ